MIEQAHEVLARSRLADLRLEHVRHLDLARLRPQQGEHVHGLGKVERLEGGVDRIGQDGVGQGDVGIGQPSLLRAEEYARARTASLQRAQLRPDAAHPDDGKFDLPPSRRGAQHVLQVGDGLRCRLEQPGVLHDRERTRRQLYRTRIGPAVARRDEPQIRQPEVQHGPRRRADVLAHLRVDEDYGRRAVGGSAHHPAELVADLLARLVGSHV